MVPLDIFQFLQSLFLLLQGLHVDLLTLHLWKELVHCLEEQDHIWVISHNLLTYPCGNIQEAVRYCFQLFSTTIIAWKKICDWVSCDACVIEAADYKPEIVRYYLNINKRYTPQKITFASKRWPNVMMKLAVIQNQAKIKAMKPNQVKKG